MTGAEARLYSLRWLLITSTAAAVVLAVVAAGEEAGAESGADAREKATEDTVVAGETWRFDAEELAGAYGMRVLRRPPAGSTVCRVACYRRK